MQFLLKAIFTTLAIGGLTVAMSVADAPVADYNGGPSGNAFLITCSNNLDSTCRGAPYNYFCNQLGQMFYSQENNDCDQNCHCAWI